jgi:hypothetical protein
MPGKKVEKLEVENFKIIEFALLQPEGYSVIIKGANGAGKSSLTDGLVAAIAGKRFFPDRPIRDGEAHAHVEATIDDFVVRRDWDLKKGEVKEKTTLRYKDGRPISSPQTFLDNLFGGAKFASFDPAAFVRDEKTQREVLLRMIGIDALLEEIKKDHALIFSKRQDVNRDIRNQQGVIAEIPIIGEDVPVELVSATGLTKKISAATKKNHENESKRTDYKNAKFKYKNVSEEIIDLKKTIASLREEQSLYASRVEELEGAEDLKDVDVSEIIVKLDSIEEQNKFITEANKQIVIRKTAEQKMEDMQSISDQYTEELQQILYKKTDALKKANFPVKGLSVDDNNILYKGMPLSQESDSMRLQIAMGIAVARIPKDGIRIIRIKEASLLDENALKEVDRIAKENDIQVFLERVGVSDKGGHLVKNGILVKDCK